MGTPTSRQPAIARIWRGRDGRDGPTSTRATLRGRHQAAQEKALGVQTFREDRGRRASS